MNTTHKTRLEIKEEEQLIQRAQENPAHFAPLYTHYYKVIIQFIYRRVDDKDLAADLTAQTFLKALHHLPSYRPKGFPFSSWLYKIAINEVNMHFRKYAKQRTFCINDQEIYQFAETLLQDVQEDKLEDITLVIQKLQVDEVELIELRFFEAYSFKEIGELLNITENNAKVKTYRIIDKIKKLLGA